MSPIVILVFAPVVIGGLAFLALLLGAATAGAWEAVEGRVDARPSPPGPARLQVAPRERTHSRAA